MKSERRHELQQNELAQQVGKLTEEVRPYTNLIIGTAVVVVVGSLVWAYISGTRQAEREMAWSQFQDAILTEDADELLAVAKQNQGTKAGYWALQTAADIKANEGAALVFTEKELAQENLIAARDHYEKVTQATVDDELLSQRAWLGLGKAEESLYGVTGDASHQEAAQKAYEKITTTWPESGVAEVAQSRIDFLAMNDSQQFYNWLAEYKPTPPPMNDPRGGGGFNPNNPAGGAPGGGGRGGLQLPGDLQLPDFDLETDPSEEEAPATELPGSQLDLDFEQEPATDSETAPPAEAPAPQPETSEAEESGNP